MSNLLTPRAIDGALSAAGLRRTPQRVAVLEHLLRHPDHATVDELWPALNKRHTKASRATVYNTLNQLTEAGLLRQIGVDGSRSFFDTTPTNHHHFFVSDENHLFDVPEPGVEFSTLPEPLPGYEIAGVDVIVHLRRKP